jgi:hypothetical protein
MHTEVGPQFCKYKKKYNTNENQKPFLYIFSTKIAPYLQKN